MRNRKFCFLLLPAILGILACGLLSPRQSPNAKIYFSVSDTLYRMNLNGSHVETVAKMGEKSEQVFVDNANKKIYVSHWSTQVFVLDLTNNTQTMIQGLGNGGGGQGIAIDPNTFDLFLGLYYDGIYKTNLNRNASWQQLVSSVSLSPLLGERGQVQIDPINRQIYFKTAYNGDCGLCRYIYRVDYDGKNLTRIIPANGGDDLALDLIAHKMYFSNLPGNATIMRANLDGSDLETIFRVPAPYSACRASALDLSEHKIYLSLYDESRDWKARAISRVNLDGTGYEILYEVTGDSGDALSGGIGLFLP
jgi:DNA-binding beta-propeller fold protein YncE